ncbi:DNA methylase family protein [Helicobacter pylori Hp P-8b]|uniref:DNA methyltransferase n=1 Tax=Helicobacter pylori TaxID=210 RepID=UPI00026B1EC4|nr:DNA methyltransferase [Helicobacter pylori]EJC04668.1 site-specific DNA-methyltransferase domain protein [Helicobacter pylori Hp P-8]EJC27478.1 DNA methylase family protein [Helicobacter pylori Hp P-8b]
MNINKVFYHSSANMNEVPDNSVDLIITSPPYFNIKDYTKNGTQDLQHSAQHVEDLGALEKYEDYLLGLLKVWLECYRVLKPNGKLCINVPLMPMLKKVLNTHYNRHIFDLHADIQHSILHDLNNTLENKPKMFLLDVYIWKRVNPTKRLMFGSYPYPRNFYAQNTIEFIGVFVKDGKPKQPTEEQKEQSQLTQEEWVEFTKQIWEIPIPNKNDIAFGKHAALSNLLYEHRSRIIPLYQRINNSYSKDKTIKICDNNLKLLYKDHQVCVNIDRKEMKLKYSENEDDFRKYIIGGWFEEYIYFELLDLLDKQVIYDLRLNMRLSVESMTDTQRNESPIYAELDMAFSDGKNLYIIECKSGGLKDKGVLANLSTNAQIFGGANAKCILISSDDHLGQNIQEKIKILNIKFIFKDFKENIENYVNDSRH